MLEILYRTTDDLDDTPKRYNSSFTLLKRKNEPGLSRDGDSFYLVYPAIIPPDFRLAPARAMTLHTGQTVGALVLYWKDFEVYVQGSQSKELQRLHISWRLSHL